MDIIATNAPVFELQSGTIEAGLSDHRLVYIVLNRKVMKPKTLITIGRSFKQFLEKAFNRDLECVPFDVAYVFDDINDVCWAREEI